MSEINSSAQTIAGVSRYSAALAGTENRGTKDLGQDDFLKLLTTQLQHQDPFKPMENGEFLSQMAQFSQLSGIEDMNATLQSLGSGMGQFRVATAANMLGQHVLVPGNLARPDDAGIISGVVDLPTDADKVTITYEDPLTGDVLHTQTMGAQTAGMVAFEWSDLPEATRMSDHGVRVNVAVTSGFEQSVVSPSVFAKVMSVNMADAEMGINYNIQDYGVMNAMEIEQIR